MMSLRCRMAAHLCLSAFPDGEEVIQGSEVDPPSLWVLDICAGHGVRFARACLPVRKDADTVPCMLLGFHNHF